MFFLSRMFNNRLHLPAPGEALPGRSRPIATSRRHAMLKAPLKGPFPAGAEQALFGLGRFWAAEALFWPVDGVLMTAAGYAGGVTPNPTYQEVATGLTGHAETVLVTFDPARQSYDALLRLFFEGHDPTQGMRQGEDVGTPYRSMIHVFSERQRRRAEAVRAAYQDALAAAGRGKVTTEIVAAGPFYYAEAEHQQYLAKTPGGLAGLAGTGIACPLPA